MSEENAAPSAPFSDEQIVSIKQLVSGIVNSSVRARDQMADKKREQDRQAILESMAKMMDEKLSSFKPAPASDDDDDKEKGGKRARETDLRLATLTRQQAETQARLAQTEKVAAERQAKLDAAELRDHVSRMLSPLGIEGMRFRAAYALIKDRIRKHSEDPDAPYVFADETTGEDIDLDTGLKSWAKGEEAKVFIPPSGASGSGARRTQASAPPTKQETTYEDVGHFVLGLTSPMGGFGER